MSVEKLWKKDEWCWALSVPWNNIDAMLNAVPQAKWKYNAVFSHCCLGNVYIVYLRQQCHPTCFIFVLFIRVLKSNKWVKFVKEPVDMNDTPVSPIFIFYVLDISRSHFSEIPLFGRFFVSKINFKIIHMLQNKNYYHHFRILEERYYLLSI